MFMCRKNSLGFSFLLKELLNELNHTPLGMASQIPETLCYVAYCHNVKYLNSFK